MNGIGFLFYFVIIGLSVFSTVMKAAKKNKRTDGRTTAGSAAEANKKAAGAGPSFQDLRRKAARAKKAGLPVADDGHVISKEDDISCRRFGHRHPEDDSLRFIPHDDPTEGYIILNGKRMLLSEADAYENTI